MVFHCLKKGANVTCLDLSDEQLKFARKVSDSEGVKINFVQGPMEDLSQFKDSSFDLIISICAIQYVKDYDKVFKEVHRILKKDGQFVFSTDDPIFYSIASKELWPDEDINDSYFYRGADSWMEEGMKFITFRRPIEDYINKLINTGFIIEGFHELPIKHIDECAKNREEEFEERFPRIMVFKSRKL